MNTVFLLVDGALIISIMLSHILKTKVYPEFRRGAKQDAIILILLVLLLIYAGLQGGIKYCFFAAIAYAGGLVMLGSIDEHLEYSDVPKALKGVPILIAATGLMAVAFHGLAVLA